MLRARVRALVISGLFALPFALAPHVASGFPEMERPAAPVAREVGPEARDQSPSGAAKSEEGDKRPEKPDGPDPEPGESDSPPLPVLLIAGVLGTFAGLAWLWRTQIRPRLRKEPVSEEAADSMSTPDARLFFLLMAFVFGYAAFQVAGGGGDVLVGFGFGIASLVWLCMAVGAPPGSRRRAWYERIRPPEK